jgi:hypothetical protein
MADADLVITGTVLTVDEARSTAHIRATFLAGRQVFAQ